MKDAPGRILPLNALRAFEAAARQLSFAAAAADELCVTPAAISHQIKGLEDYLGVSLFRRFKRRVVLTDQGQLIQKPKRTKRVTHQPAPRKWTIVSLSIPANTVGGK